MALSPWLSQPVLGAAGLLGPPEPGKPQQNANDVINPWAGGSGGKVARKGRDHVTLPFPHYIIF